MLYKADEDECAQYGTQLIPLLSILAGRYSRRVQYWDIGLLLNTEISNCVIPCTILLLEVMLTNDDAITRAVMIFPSTPFSLSTKYPFESALYVDICKALNKPTFDGLAMLLRVSVREVYLLGLLADIMLVTINRLVDGIWSMQLGDRLELHVGGTVLLLLILNELDGNTIYIRYYEPTPCWNSSTKL